MEDKFYNDEFEQFLRQQANNHRMYPTDGVWQGIYKKLHGDKKWPALTIAAFAFLTATIAISLYFAPKPNIFAISPTKVSTSSSESSSSKAFQNPLNSSINSGDENYISQKNSTSGLQNQIDVVTNEISKASSGNQLSSISVEPKRRITATSIQESPSRVIINDEMAFNEQSEKDELLDLSSVPSPKKNVSVVSAITNESPETTPSDNIKGTKKEQDADDKNIADEFLKQHKNDIDLYTTSRKIGPKNKVSYTVYIAPSLSYRKLKDETFNSKNVNLNGPVGLNYVTDVNKIVRHKPGTGIEAGVGFKYHLSNTFGIKAGFQFNVRQYNIEAYRSSVEIATIALLRNSGVDTINSYAVYRNNNGYVAADLVNRYYQLSIPIGIEWEVIGNNTFKFNVAANIQPTYIINRNSYLLSTNFKNYTENSGMLRNWNINSNIEAFMSIKVGDFRWQLGPQFRYQHLPTFITQYPIREHLMDYGFKIGVSKFIK